MAERMRCVVSRRRAHDAITEILTVYHENQALRESIDAFGRKLVAQGLSRPDDPHTWQVQAAVEILGFLTEGHSGMVLKCEERRHERIKAKAEGNTDALER